MSTFTELVRLLNIRALHRRIDKMEDRMGALDDVIARFRSDVEAETSRIGSVLADLKARLDSGDANAASQVSEELAPVIDTLRAIGTGGAEDPIPEPGDGGETPGTRSR